MPAAHNNGARRTLDRDEIVAWRESVRTWPKSAERTKELKRINNQLSAIAMRSPANDPKGR